MRLPTSGLWTIRRTWKFTKHTFVRYFNLYARKNKLYANLKKCVFAASGIPLLKCIAGKLGVHPDPEKIKAITDLPVPVDLKGLKTSLG